MTLAAVLACAALGASWDAPRAGAQPPEQITIGTKKFTESVLLGQLAAGLAGEAGSRVRMRGELGGTRVLWNALLAGDIDLYPEYTGTLIHEILPGRDIADLETALSERGVSMTAPLGFDNTYALGMNSDRADALGVKRISDLRDRPALRFGFTNEFMSRADGWPGLRSSYRLPHHDVRGLDHDLAYRGLAAGDIDVVDVYSTDAEIAYYGLRVLEDDRGYFPEYRAMFLYRTELGRRAPRTLAAIRRLEANVSAADMIRMNAASKIDRRAEPIIAAEFLAERLDVTASPVIAGRAARIVRRTLEHLYLVTASLGAAILVAIPIGIAAARNARVARPLLGLVGVVQTIPSLALLVFMIPLLGIGTAPALAALFLYSLLPIVRNTHSGLRDIPQSILESADAMGLPRSARLRAVELPLATRSILAGIKTSAVINVGTATLGALIGAGGYGQPILTGIRLDDQALILEGAVPAALLALVVQWSFDAVERRVVSRGLQSPA